MNTNNNCLTVAERDTNEKSLATIFVSATRKWIDNASRLAVSTTATEKFFDLHERLKIMRHAFLNDDYSKISEILAIDQVIDSSERILKLSSSVIKQALSTDKRRFVNAVVALEEYLTDRERRLSFIRTEDGKYRLRTEQQLNRVFQDIDVSLKNTNRKDVCSCLANEATIISRGMAPSNFETKILLDDFCKQIVRNSIFKSRNLSV